MDDRDHHDTNVVNLRRREDSGGRDRGQVASTIFADQDEISTFSQGNLVPPSPPPPADEDSPRAADPFFEEHTCGSRARSRTCSATTRSPPRPTSASRSWWSRARPSWPTSSGSGSSRRRLPCPEAPACPSMRAAPLAADRGWNGQMVRVVGSRPGLSALGWLSSRRRQPCLPARRSRR